jgi:hypothetical protein
VVWPTTPLENRGGISRDREEPSEEEESRRARLLPPNIQERSGLRIRIDLMRIRIPHFFSLRIRIQFWIQNFDDQKLKKLKLKKECIYF